MSHNHVTEYRLSMEAGWDQPNPEAHEQQINAYCLVYTVKSGMAVLDSITVATASDTM